jgi:hypothetical protein
MQNILTFKNVDRVECVRHVPRFEILSLFDGNVLAFLVANKYTPLPIDTDLIGTYSVYYF